MDLAPSVSPANADSTVSYLTELGLIAEKRYWEGIVQPLLNVDYGVSALFADTP